MDSKGCYFRDEPEAADGSLLLLGVSPDSLFFEFYHTYEGPFGSDFIGYILSEVLNGIAPDTNYFRENQGFLFQHLVISDMCAYAVLVYDCITDRVYNVDFEGGVERLIAGTLEPQWPSFEAFLDFYFLGVGVDDFLHGKNN